MLERFCLTAVVREFLLVCFSETPEILGTEIINRYPQKNEGQGKLRIATRQGIDMKRLSDWIPDRILFFAK